MWAILSMAILPWSTSADTTGILIPRLTGIVIDGSFDDWKGKGFHDGILMPVGKEPRLASNCDAELWLGWDSRGLLIRIAVKDDAFIEEDDTTALYKGDGIELFLSPRRGSRDIGQWVLSPGMDQNHREVRFHFYDQRKNRELKTHAAPLEVKRRPYRDGYELEARIGWGALDINPEKNKEIAFQAIANDKDSETESNADPYRIAFYPQLDSYRNSNAMHTLVLSQQSDLPVQAKMTTSIDSDSGHFRVSVWGREELVGKKIELRHKGKSLAKGRLEAVGERSHSMVRFPAETIEDSLARLELFSNDRRLGSHVLVGYNCFGNLLKGTRFLRKQFRLDEPFRELSSADAFVRRHRGLAALAIYWVENFGNDGDIHEEMIRYGAEFANGVRSGKKEFLENKRGEFWSAYFSTADGSGQPFVTSVPENYSPEKAYPLIVNLHGLGGRPRPNPEAVPSEKYLQVRPWGRGDTWYAGLGENDILQVIQYMKQWYSVDENRVYVVGGSMGGRGTWAMASLHPDLFAAAAPTCGWADGLPLENLLNVPLLNQHGDVDWIVSVEQSRFAVDRLRNMNSPVIYREHAGAGHGIKRPMDKFTWVLSHTRDTAPRQIRHTCGTVRRGKAYWTTVCRMKNPHRNAQVTATVNSSESTQSITFGLKEVGVLRVDLAGAPLDSERDLLLQCNQQLHTLTAPLADSIFIVDSADTYVLKESWNPEESKIRPYRAGAAANLYDGEPLVVVYGTTQDGPATRARRLWAERLAKHGGAAWGPMGVGGTLVLADTSVSEDDLKRYNLLLIGGPKENRLVGRMWDQFPFTVNRKNQLIAGDREPLILDSAGIRFAYYNPLAPKRLIFLLTVPRSPEWMETHIHEAPHILTGSWGTARPGRPDLVVADPVRDGFGNRCKRAMQFTHGWKWRLVAGTDRPILPAFHSEANRVRAEARLQRRIADVDYVLFRNDSDLIYCDTSSFTLADQRVAEGEEKELIVGDLSGHALARIGLNREDTPVGIYPAPNPGDVASSRTYRVALPPTLTWELNKYKMSLRNVKSVRYCSHELWGDLFGE